MKKSVFQKAVSLFLCAVLIAGVLPEMHLHSHAEEMAGTTELTEEQRQHAVANWKRMIAAPAGE